MIAHVRLGEGDSVVVLFVGLAVVFCFVVVAIDAVSNRGRKRDKEDEP